MSKNTTNVTLTRDQVREVDRLAVEQLGMPGIVLMENAAIHAVDALLTALERERGIGPVRARVVVLCGGGNNGGDGYAMARHLHNRGAAVVVFALKGAADLRGDAATNHHICERMGLEIVPVLDAEAVEVAASRWEEADVVVDALLGTGFAGAVRPPMSAAIERVNALDRPMVLAVDVPSGLDCQSGAAAATTVRADLTVTFVANKVGFTQPDAAAWLGNVIVADIGAPPALIDRVLTQGDGRN